MDSWPAGALTRDEVEDRLAAGAKWRIEWCAGGASPAVEGAGERLPGGVLEQVPTRAKRRKMQRGLQDNRTWMFVVEGGSEEDRLLEFHEGPMY
jgi:hypothetical protein